MVWVGRDLEGDPVPLGEHLPLSQAAPTWTLPGMGQPRFSGKAVPGPPMTSLMTSAAMMSPHLLDVHQLGLVDLGDGDVVLGSDGEAALGTGGKRDEARHSREAARIPGSGALPCPCRYRWLRLSS